MRTLRCLLVVSVLVISFAAEALAIPAFARKYDMSCSTCHSPIPKLKPFGDEFAANGYQMAGKEPPRYFRETGDDKLLLMRELPLAVRIDGFVEAEQNGGLQTDLQSPVIMKLLSGGQVAKDVSYYFYFLMTEEGNIVGPEDAFLYFNNLFDRDLDLIVGQFQVSDPLFKRELRLTREDYKVYSTQVGTSSAGLTYDRGITISYGLPTNTDIHLSILNGNGIGPASAAGFMDNDKNKNLMLRVAQEVTGQVRVGGFGYYGNEEQGGNSNRTLMAGPDVTIDLGPVQLNSQFVRRIDNNPFFGPGAADKTTDGYFAELIYSPNGDKSDWYGVLLHNMVTSDVPGLAWHTLTVGYHRAIARNLRLVGELTADIQQKTTRLSIGTVCAF